MHYTVTLENFPEFLTMFSQMIKADKKYIVDIKPDTIMIEDTAQYQRDCELVDQWRSEHPNHREYIWE
jgi:hypothetical protein